VRILKNVNLNLTESLAKTEMIEMGMIGTKHVPEELMLHDLSGMFEMGTGRLLVKDGVGGTAKTVLEQIITWRIL
jgi:hypothetical protein